MHWMVLALAAVMSLECPEIQLREPVPGRLLVTIAPRGDPATRRVCLIEGGRVSGLSLTTPWQLGDVNWGPSSDQLFMSFCNPGRGPQTRCPIALMTIGGQVIRTYPDESSPAFVEPDGRWAHWILTGARPSPDGTTAALSVSGHQLLMRLSDGAYIANLPGGVCERAWSPDGTRLAYTRGSGPHAGCAVETQLFLYDLSSGVESQLTHFEPKEYRPWWNPFAMPVIRPPLVAGLSWARHNDVILFYLVPDRGVFLWNSEGRELHRIRRFGRDCWRRTQLSADGQRILYLSASRPDLCALAVEDEVRLVDADGHNDRVVARTDEQHDVITDIDWWTDSSAGRVERDVEPK